MTKYIKFLRIILLIVFFLPTIKTFSQEDVTNYGKDAPLDKNQIKAIQQGFFLKEDGFHPPLTKKEERVRKKARRLSLSMDDLRIINIYEMKKNGEFQNMSESFQKMHKLTIIDKLKYPVLKHKKKKLEKLEQEAAAKGFNNTPNSDTLTTIGFGSDTLKYKLTPQEEEIIKKKETDSVDLTKEELKIYKKAKKKQQKKQKYLAKTQKYEITEDEKKLLEYSKNSKDSLSKEEKKRIKYINKKLKHNEKIEEKKYQFSLDSNFAAGGWIPVDKKLPLKTKLRLYLKKFSRTKKKAKPSSYVKKIMKINKKYTPTLKQKDALNKAKNGVHLNWIDKQRAKRAAVKIYLKKSKTLEVQKKEYYKYQPKAVRKEMKKKEKESAKKQKRKNPYPFTKKLRDFWRKIT